MVIELVYVEGFEPTQSSISNFVNFLKARTFKPNGITVEKRAIASPGNSTYTNQEIIDILKKTIYYTNKTNPKIVLNKKDDDYNNLTIRKKIDVENFYFSDNFKENFNIYIKNKIM